VTLGGVILGIVQSKRALVKVDGVIAGDHGVLAHLLPLFLRHRELGQGRDREKDDTGEGKGRKDESSGLTILATKNQATPTYSEYFCFKTKIFRVHLKQKYSEYVGVAWFFVAHLLATQDGNDSKLAQRSLAIPSVLWSSFVFGASLPAFPTFLPH